MPKDFYFFDYAREPNKIYNFAFDAIYIEYNMANLNCIKAVLVEKGIMSKWLAKTLQKDPATVSKWCNNHSQPDLYTLARIAEVLDVDIHKLICHTKEE